MLENFAMNYGIPEHITFLFVLKDTPLILTNEIKKKKVLKGHVRFLSFLSFIIYFISFSSFPTFETTLFG